MSQAALGPSEEAPAAAPTPAASRFAGLVPTAVRRHKIESGRVQEGGKRHHAIDSRDQDTTTALAGRTEASEAGGAGADGDTPLWRTLAVHDACEALIDGKWRAVAVVGVTHGGYEIARYRVRTTAAADQRGHVAVHEVSSAEVRRFLDVSGAPPDRPECTFFARDGHCKRGAKCKFAHVPTASYRAEVATAIAAAASDRAAAAATASSASASPSARFFPERGEARAARDADAFLQGLQGLRGRSGAAAATPQSAAAGGGLVDDSNDDGDDGEEERLAQQRLEEEMAERARAARPAGGTYSLQALHPG